MSSTEPPGWANPGPGYGPPPSYGVIPGAPTTPWPRVPAPAPTGRSTGTPALAVVAIAVSGVALIAALLAMVMVGRTVATAGLDDDEDGYATAYSLPGKLGERPAGSGVSAAELQTSLTRVLESDGSDVDSISCPATPKLVQGVVTPCHAELDGDDWSVVAIFEDSSGHYTALIS